MRPVVPSYQRKKKLVMLPADVMVKGLGFAKKLARWKGHAQWTMLPSSNVPEGYPGMTGWDRNANFALHF